MRSPSHFLAQIPDGLGSLATAQRWLQENGLNFARNLLVALLIYWVGRLLGRWVRGLLIGLAGEDRIDATAARYVGNIASALIQAFAIFTALGQLGIPSAQFAAVVGAAGLAIGLALQGNLSNFAAGVLIVFLRPFRRGDLIGTTAGLEGVVDEIQAFSTILHTSDGRRVIVPNATLTGNPLVNFTSRGRRAVALKFPAPRGTDVAQLRAALLEEIRGVEGVMADPPPTLVLRDVAAEQITLELTAWTEPGRYSAVQAVLAERLAGIEHRTAPADASGVAV